MSNYDWFDHPTPPPAEPEWEKWRGMGFHPVWFGEVFIGGVPVMPDAWRCRRGCGTFVWDPAEHIKNVCTSFEPVVGGVQAPVPAGEAPKVVHLDHPLDGAICGGDGWATSIQENVSCDKCRKMIEELKL